MIHTTTCYEPQVEIDVVLRFNAQLFFVSSDIFYKQGAHKITWKAFWWRHMSVQVTQMG